MHRRVAGALAARCVLLSLGWLYGLNTQAAEAGYVEAVEADAAEFATHEFQAPAGSTWTGSANAEGEGGGQSGSLEGFSKFLLAKSPGSHIFYRKLPYAYQKKLHQDYLATGDLERIKDGIFKYTRELKSR
jgi:hypothetical protein